MGGITLEGRELLVPMDALNCMSVIGLEGLFPRDVAAHRKLIFEGIEALRKRGLMEVRDGQHVLSVELVRMASVMAAPTFVIETIRGAPDGTQLKYLHYLQPPRIVEVSLPAENQYVLGVLSTPTLMLERIQKVVPLQPPSDRRTFEASVSKQIVSEMLSLDRVGELNEEEATTALRREGLAEEGTALLVEAMKNPVFAGTVTLMEVREGTVMARWNVTLVQGQTLAWQFRTDPASPAQVEVKTIQPLDLRATLEGWARQSAPR